MKRIALILGVIGALAAGLLVGMPSAVAASTETDYAVDGVAPNMSLDEQIANCTDGDSWPWTTACLQKYGDLIWVSDNIVDSRSAYAYWENYLRDPSGNWVLYRWGRCIDNLGSAAGWTYCDKSFYEDQTKPNALGGQGSGLRLYPCIENVGCDSNYKWVRNNA